jgi:ATP-dependent RNA helicase HelY
MDIWSGLEADEAGRGLELTREPDTGFVWPVYRWARGEPLSKVLASAQGLDGDLPAGDFVRWARQVVDLLGQLAEAAGVSAPVRETARAAMGAINRGVLAYNSVN